MSLRDFVILSKIGKLFYPTFHIQIVFNNCPFDNIGDGAYSEVYKVKRLSDNQIYALKKVRNIIDILNDI